MHTRHGSGCSPHIQNGVISFSLEQEKVKKSPFASTWMALKTSDGSLLWESKRKTAVSNSFSTACPINVDGKPALVFTGEGDGFTCVDNQTGKEVWSLKTVFKIFLD